MLLRRYIRRQRVRRAKKMKRLHKFSKSSKRKFPPSRRVRKRTMMKRVRSTAILPVLSNERTRSLKHRLNRRSNPQRTCRQ